MWISEPTPVISSTKLMDSGSMRMPNSTWRSPTGIQSKTCRFCIRCDSANPVEEKKRITPYTKDATTVAQPSRWPQAFEALPPSSRTAAPISGNAISSQAPPAAPLASWTFWASASRNVDDTDYPSVLQQVGVVHGGRPAGTEDRHDDREPDDHLGRGHHHYEEGHDLAVQRAVDARERDQRQVHRVQHQLDAHEHDDRVAPDQHPDRADGEQQSRQQQIDGWGHFESPSRVGFKARASAAGAVPATALRSSSNRSAAADSMSLDSDSGAIEPSGRSAGVATEVDVAKTPGPGSGDGRSCSPRKRASTSSFCVLRPRVCRST